MKRTPLARKTPLRREPRLPRGARLVRRGAVRASPRNRDRRDLERECDALCRRWVVELRDRNVCQKTGARTRIQWAHVHTRGHKRLRHDPDNSLALSAGAHLWWHQHPTEAAAWFAAAFPERAERLRIKRRTDRALRLDLAATRLWLLQQIERTLTEGR